MALERQGPTTKSRPVLSRTLVLVLNPLSGTCSPTVHRLSSKKIENVFYDFQKCNELSISVPLRDAIDDIDLVGWLSPFILLIHGSSEDMDTIQQAWVGRMLKPPSNFLIKYFGEISTLDMKQIPQSQFISIRETLLQIISTLNENEISATVECIMTRLYSSFDSIIIPPASAITRSLDFLVNKMELDVIEGSYYVKTLNISNDHDRLQYNPLEPHLGGEKTTIESRETLDNDNTHRYPNHRYPNLEHEIPKSNANATESDWKGNQTKLHAKEKNTSTIKHPKGDSKIGHKIKVGKRSPKKLKMKVSQRNHFYKKLTNPVEDEALDDSIVNRNKLLDKRSSILAKLSRLFRRSLSEDELGNGECQSDEGKNNCGHQRHFINDKRTSFRNHKERRKGKEMECLERRTSAKENKNDFSSKRYCGKHEHDRRRQVEKEVTSATKHKIIQKSHSQSSTVSAKKSSSRSPKLLHAGKEKYGSKRRQVQDSSSDFSSSISDSSDFTDRPNSDSYSSVTCIDLPIKSFRYFQDDTVGQHRQTEPNGNLNFSSTQAICGDIEVSFPSLLTLSDDCTQQSFPSATEEQKGITKSTQGNTGIEEQKGINKSIQGNTGIQNQNILQLIGVL